MLDWPPGGWSLCLGMPYNGIFTGSQDPNSYNTLLGRFWMIIEGGLHTVRSSWFQSQLEQPEPFCLLRLNVLSLSVWIFNSPKSAECMLGKLETIKLTGDVNVSAWLSVLALWYISDLQAITASWPMCARIGSTPKHHPPPLPWPWIERFRDGWVTIEANNTW